MTTLSRISKSIIAAAILTAALLLFSFVHRNTGGEGFEVYLNDKLMLQQFGPISKDTKILNLEKAGPADKLSVKYYHCGNVPKSSLLTLRNEKNDVLKKWMFSAAKEKTVDVSCKAGEILNLGKEKSGLQLYFSSTEIPDGRLLAAIRMPAMKKGF